MRATIITLAMTALFCFTNISSSTARGGEKIYKSTIVDENTGVKTVTISKGRNGKYLTPLQMYTLKTDNMGNPEEKVIYSWNSKKGWIKAKRYTYRCEKDGQINQLSMAEWNSSLNNWEKDKHSIYTNNEGDIFLLTENSPNK